MIEEVIVSYKLLKKMLLKRMTEWHRFSRIALDNISVTKVSFVTKFYQLLLLIALP